MQSRPVLNRQEHVLHKNKCLNLMLTLRSCFSNNFFDPLRYLNFAPNYFKLSSLSDDRTFVYVNCVNVIGPEHPSIIHVLHNKYTYNVICFNHGLCVYYNGISCI